MTQYTCEPCGFSSQYKSSLINHMKSKKHLEGGKAGYSPPHTTDPFAHVCDVPTDGSSFETHLTADMASPVPPNIHLIPEEHGAAILFLEMKSKMQEMRISELEEVIHSLAEDIQTLKETPVIDTQNNTTNNVNLMVQMTVDEDHKLGVTSGMGLVPDLPDVVRDQLEHIIPLSIKALFAKNQRMIEEEVVNDEQKKSILCQEVVEEVEVGEDATDGLESLSGQH